MILDDVKRLLSELEKSARGKRIELEGLRAQRSYLDDKIKILYKEVRQRMGLFTTSKRLLKRGFYD